MTAVKANVLAVLTDRRTLLRGGLLGGLLSIVWPFVVVASIGRFVKLTAGDLVVLSLQGLGWGAVAGATEWLEREGARRGRPVLTGLVGVTTLWALYVALVSTLAYAAASLTGGPDAGFAAVGALLTRSWVQTTAFAGLIFAAPHAALAATRAARANGWAQASLALTVTSAAFLLSLPPDPLGFIPRGDLALFALLFAAAVALPMFGVAWVVDRQLTRPTTPAHPAPPRRRGLASRLGREDGSWRWIAVATALLVVQAATFHERPGALRARRVAAAVGDLDDPAIAARKFAAFRLLAVDARRELALALVELALAGDDVAAGMAAGVMTEADRERVREAIRARDRRPERRARALLLLRAVADASDLPAFLEGTRDRDARVRLAAAQALAGERARPVADELSAFVRDPLQQNRDYQERYLVADVRASKEVAARVAELLGDPAPEVRAAADELEAYVARRDGYAWTRPGW